MPTVPPAAPDAPLRHDRPAADRSGVPHFVETAYPLAAARSPERRFLPADRYGEALSALVIACVDLAFVCGDRWLLGKRRVDPGKGWWVVGGRMFPGEAPLETAIRKAREEAGLDLPGDRFRFLGVYSTALAPRSQPPVEDGLHSVNLTYAVSIAPAERDRLRLDPQEYETGRWDPRDRPPTSPESPVPGDRALVQIWRDLGRVFPPNGAQDA